jgi:hypothetical protein
MIQITDGVEEYTVEDKTKEYIEDLVRGKCTHVQKKHPEENDRPHGGECRVHG